MDKIPHRRLPNLQCISHLSPTGINNQNRREIHLPIFDLNLGHIGCPLLVRHIGMKVSVDYIRCNLAQFPFIRTVALLLSLGSEAHLNHQFLDGLVININTIGV